MHTYNIEFTCNISVLCIVWYSCQPSPIPTSQGTVTKCWMMTSRWIFCKTSHICWPWFRVCDVPHVPHKNYHKNSFGKPWCFPKLLLLRWSFLVAFCHKKKMEHEPCNVTSTPSTGSFTPFALWERVKKNMVTSRIARVALNLSFSHLKIGIPKRKVL